MGRNKEENARFAGAAWALEMCEKDGIEACRKELEYRGILHIPLRVTHSQIEEANNYVKRNLMCTMMILSVSTLCDEFDFDKDRVEQFMDRLTVKAKCLIGKYATWKDIKDTIEEEIGIKIPLPDEFLEENYD